MPESWSQEVHCTSQTLLKNLLNKSDNAKIVVPVENR